VSERSANGQRVIYGPAGIVAIFTAAILLVDPRGNFPLNDDWNFALATWWFSEHGVFRFARATAMSLRGQVVWGALWTQAFGESFEVLRASALVLSLGTVLLLHRLLRQCGVAALPRFVVAMALLFHPIYFWSSFTYMTELPFVCASVVAFYLFSRGYLEKSIPWIAAGGIAVLISCWIRQTGIANALPPIVLILVLRSRWMPAWRTALVVACAPLAIFSVLFVMTDSFVGYPEEIAMHYEAWRGGAEKLLQGASFAGQRLSENAQYSALFFLPLLLPLFAWLGRSRRRWLLWMVSIAAVAPLASSRVTLGEPMPYRTFGNVFVNLGLGPLTLRDTWVFAYRLPSHLDWWPRLILTFAAVVCGALLLAILVATVATAFRSADAVKPVAAMAAVHGLASTVVLAASPFYFDRYSLDSLWSVAVVAALTLAWPAWRTLVSAAGVALFAFFSIVFTAEYLSWNRARWDAFRWLTDRGVSLRQLDGGYEINQYLIGGFDGVAGIGKFQFSVIDDAWIITFNEVRGYRTIREVPYKRMLRRDATIFAQERTTGFAPRFQLDEAGPRTDG
jgi:hypothetical protein